MPPAHNSEDFGGEDRGLTPLTTVLITSFALNSSSLVFLGKSAIYGNQGVIRVLKQGGAQV